MMSSAGFIGLGLNFVMERKIAMGRFYAEKDGERKEGEKRVLRLQLLYFTLICRRSFWQ